LRQLFFLFRFIFLRLCQLHLDLFDLCLLFLHFFDQVLFALFYGCFELVDLSFKFSFFPVAVRHSRPELLHLLLALLKGLVQMECLSEIDRLHFAGIDAESRLQLDVLCDLGVGKVEVSLLVTFIDHFRHVDCDDRELFPFFLDVVTQQKAALLPEVFARLCVEIKTRQPFER